MNNLRETSLTVSKIKILHETISIKIMTKPRRTVIRIKMKREAALHQNNLGKEAEENESERGHQTPTA